MSFDIIGQLKRTLKAYILVEMQKYQNMGQSDIKHELKEDIKREIKKEIKRDLKENLRDDFEEEIKEEIYSHVDEKMMKIA